MFTRRRKTTPAATGKTRRTSTPNNRKAEIREEYRAALENLNRFSHNNQTREARQARERFDKADKARRQYWGMS